MRDPDRGDVDLVLKLYDLRRETEMRRARTFIMEFEPTSVEDVMAVASFAHPENAHFRQVTSYWGMVADFVVRGLFHPEMFAAHCGESLFLYAKFEPFLAEVRTKLNPLFLANIEAAVKSHPAVSARLEMVRQIRARMAAAAPAMAKAKGQAKPAPRAKRAR